MSEPTKGQIEEANALAEKYGIEGLDWDERHDVRLALMLADVRKQARDDALEEAKAALNDERVDGTVSPEDAAYNTAIDHCIGALDALKDQPTGEPQ